MRWLSFALASYAGLVTAHRDHAIPHVVGGRQILAELRARGVIGNHEHQARYAEAPLGTSENKKQLDKRQNSNTEGNCGPGVGSCADGYCCSPAGWCGQGKAYCSAPDCQIDYGTGCDALKKPNGVDTTNIDRPHVGNIPYGGVGIYSCVTKGDIALTYDDGPYAYTGDLLDIFKRYGMVATFFVTGNNIGKGMINSPSYPWREYIQRMVNEGHQVASHTWSHQNASQLTDAQYRQQINYNEIAIADIIGYFPTYMRPPYSICGKRCQELLFDLGYHVIYFNLDTQGYLHDTPEGAQIGKDIWDAAVGPANPADNSFLQIEHDLQKQSVYNLTEYFLKSIKTKGFRSVPVGVCLGDEPANWYRKVSKEVPTAWPPAGVNLATPSAAAATSTPTGMKVSTDASCGNGITCQGSQFGNCCSSHGWCGSGPDWCGDGCQSSFGTCSNSVSSSSASVTTFSSGSARPSAATSSATSDASTNSASSSSAPSTSMPSSITLESSTSTIIPPSTDSTTSLSAVSMSSSSASSPLTASEASFVRSNSTAATTIITFGTVSSSSSGLSTSTTSNAISSSSTSASASSSSTSLSSQSSSIKLPNLAASVSTSSSTSSSNSILTSTQVAATTSNSQDTPSSSARASSSTFTPSTSRSSSSTSSTTTPRTTTPTSSSFSTSSARATSTTTSNLNTAGPAVKTTPAIKASTNGKCGKTLGMTCEGTDYPPCCNKKNECSYSCIVGCQNEYGFCLF